MTARDEPSIAPDAPALFRASVPVFRHYLGQARGLVNRCKDRPDVLSARLAPDMFTAAEQFATAAGFSLRVSFPLAGQDVPEFPQDGMEFDGLMSRIDRADGLLADLQPAAFTAAESRRIRHRAGFAELDQTGEDFLHLFGMPNFMFHMSMGFAVLRQRGLDIGKSDFDGLHEYPHGFRF